MKKLTLTTIIVIIMVLNMANAQDSVYYYSNETQRYLYIDTTKLLLKFNNLSPAEGFNLILPQFSQLTYDSSLAWALDSFGVFGINNSVSFQFIS